MNDNFAWMAAAIALATISTGGGASVGRDAESRRDLIGRDQINYDALDAGTWREFVARDMREQAAIVDELRQRINMMLLVCLFMFVAGAILTGFTIRQFDQIQLQIDRNNDRIERWFEQQQQQRFTIPQS